MATSTEITGSQAYTHADLALMPDDGRRYEIIDGTLLVSPAPAIRHQAVVLAVARLLEDGQPRTLKTFVAPLDVVLADDSVVQPDVVVARRADLTAANLPAAPVLAVEVLSPSTRRIDLLLKHSRYAAAGVQSYWAVDPDEPRVVCFALDPAGVYQVVADVAGDQALELTHPFPVRLVPAELVDLP